MSSERDSGIPGIQRLPPELIIEITRYLYPSRNDVVSLAFTGHQMFDTIWRMRHRYFSVPWKPRGSDRYTHGTKKQIKNAQETAEEVVFQPNADWRRFTGFSKCKTMTYAQYSLTYASNLRQQTIPLIEAAWKPLLLASGGQRAPQVVIEGSQLREILPKLRAVLTGIGEDPRPSRLSFTEYRWSPNSTATLFNLESFRKIEQVDFSFRRFLANVGGGQIVDMTWREDPICWTLLNATSTLPTRVNGGRTINLYDPDRLTLLMATSADDQSPDVRPRCHIPPGFKQATTETQGRDTTQIRVVFREFRTDDEFDPSDGLASDAANTTDLDSVGSLCLVRDRLVSVLPTWDSRRNVLQV